MSYSLIGHFVDVKNHRILASADVSFLKNLNSRSYSAQFYDVDATGGSHKDEFPELTTDDIIEFEGYYDERILEESKLAVKGLTKYTPDANTKSKESYLVEKSFLDEHRDIFDMYEVTLSVEDILKGVGVSIYIKKSEKVEGLWYKASDFESAKDKIYKEYEDIRKRVDRLESIKDTKEWFEWSEEGRNNLLEELSWEKDDLENRLWAKEALDKILNIFDFFNEDMGYRYLTQWGETKYRWNYDEPREIEIFIEVC